MTQNFNRFVNFPRNQIDAYAQRSDSVDLSREMIIQSNTTGNIKYETNNGVAVTKAMVVGEVLIPLVRKIWSTGTTVTSITGYY